jgi:hypothetical protein
MLLHKGEMENQVNTRKCTFDVISQIHVTTNVIQKKKLAPKLPLPD